MATEAKAVEEDSGTQSHGVLRSRRARYSLRHLSGPWLNAWLDPVAGLRAYSR